MRTAGYHFFEGLRVEDFDVFVFDRNQAFVVKLGQRAADGFEFQPQIAADFFARHPQDEIVGGKSARVKALGQVKQERRQTFFGAHIAQKQHHSLVAHDFAAHQPEKMASQAGDVVSQLFDVGEGQLTHFAVFQSHRVAAVDMGTNAVHADEFAGHKKAGNLIATVLTGNRGFEKTGTDGKQRRERLTGAEQIFTLLQAAALSDDRVQLCKLIGQKPDRQAEFTQRTGRTQGFHLMHSIVCGHKTPLKLRFLSCHDYVSY